MDANDVRLHISWFSTAMPVGEAALGDREDIAWGDFVSVFEYRREADDKDGCAFAPSRFAPEPDGRVRRLKANALARTAVALDVETNKKTGATPPSLDIALGRLTALGLAGVGYTSHNNRAEDARYRLVAPLSEEINPHLPVVEVIADRLGLTDVLDHSKRGPASLFYLPSCPYDVLDLHQTRVAAGKAIDAGWVVEQATALLAAQQAERDRLEAAAHAEAAARRAARLAAGFDPDAGLIERIREHLDLRGLLASHGYDRSGSKYRHRNSQSKS
jgi:hypothetical protein